MVAGYSGKIAFVDLTTAKIREERLDEDLLRSFIGGHGLGVRVLFERQKAGIDPLGPENILGITTGPLTGTQTPTGSRYMVVCKSPLTGGWGDANAGGYFGSELKAAGFDAIFFSGIAPSPRYLIATDSRLKLMDASHLWGKDTVETEDILSKELGITNIKVAAIGPASEKLSLISGIVNDRGRIAARSGVGAVMGAKRLKAIVAHGKEKIVVANKAKLDELRQTFLKGLHEPKGLAKVLMDYGTCGATAAMVAGGDTPIKNWILAGEQGFPTVSKIADGNNVIKYQMKKYGCANCPMACGGRVKVNEGPYPIEEAHKAEYETIAAFGTMCLNDDLLSIFKMNDMCNRSGLDTISAGGTLAFAMECFERGIITKKDTEGIELTWGNSGAMIAMLTKIINREGIGDILADGVKVAARKIGKNSEEYAMEVGGQEPGLRSPIFMPSRGTGFVCDPTPGRHTAAPMVRLDTGSPVYAPYPELQFHNLERYEYKKKGPASATVSCYWQVGACAGLCLFPVIFFGDFPLIDFLNAVTGWNMNINEALETGARIQTLRQSFNIREGIKPSEIRPPKRMVEMSADSGGPLAGIKIDIDSLASEYHKGMGWDPDTGRPTDASLERLGLKKLVKNLGKSPN